MAKQCRYYAIDDGTNYCGHRHRTFAGACRCMGACDDDSPFRIVLIEDGDDGRDRLAEWSATGRPLSGRLPSALAEWVSAN